MLPPTFRVPEPVNRILLSGTENVMLLVTVADPVDMRSWPVSLPLLVNASVLHVNVPASTERETKWAAVLGQLIVAVPETFSALVLSAKFTAASFPVEPT